MHTRRADVQTTTYLLFANAMQVKTEKKMFIQTRKNNSREISGKITPNILSPAAQFTIDSLKHQRLTIGLCFVGELGIGIAALRPELINEILNKHELQIFIKNLLTKK